MIRTIRQEMQRMQIREILAGGPGSGCQGPNCGRKSTGSRLLKLESLHNKLKRSLKSNQYNDEEKSKVSSRLKKARHAFESKNYDSADHHMDRAEAVLNQADWRGKHY